MKSLQIFLLAITVFFAGNAVAQKASPKTQAPASTLPPVKLKTFQDSLQYALGAFVGNFLGRAGFSSIKANTFLAGMDDVLGNHPRLISDSLIYPFLNNYQAGNLKKIGKTLETEMFNALKDKPDIGKLPSGVQYRILKAGKGPKPNETDSVVIHFKGTLPDGSVFENTYLKNTPTLITPATLIPGLSEALQLMPVGSTWLVFIPSALGYGEKGNGDIPPNSALMITVELLEIRGKK